MKHLKHLLCLLLCVVATGLTAQAQNVAKIGDTEYATLQEAVDAVPTDGTQTTMTMLQAALVEGFTTASGQNINIAMGGKRVNLSTPAQVVAGSTLTLSGSGMLGTDGNNAGTALIDNYGTLNFGGAQVLGKVTGKNGSTTNVNTGTLYVTLVGESGAAVNIAGNTSSPRFTAGFGSVTAQSGSTFTITGGSMRTDLNVEDGADVTISGGNFKTKLQKEWCAEGYVPTLSSGTTPYGVVKEADAWAKLVQQDGSEFYYTQYLVASGLNTYSSDGDKMVLLVDHSTRSLSIQHTDKAVTLDLNGYSLKGLTVWRGDVTVVNGTILDDIDVYAQVENSGKVSNLTIGEGCTAKNGIILWPEDDEDTGTGYDANITVLGTVEEGIFVHGNLEAGNSVVNVENGGKVVDEDGIAIAMNGMSTVNVKDGATVTGGTTAIEVRAGELNVSGGTITGGSGTTSAEGNESGSTTQNAGIAISQHTTKLPIALNVTGGEITATTALYIVNPQNNDDTAGSIDIAISGDEAYPNFVGRMVIEDDRAALTISGGFFDDPVREKDCADGYYPFGPLANGKYTVRKNSIYDGDLYDWEDYTLTTARQMDQVRYHREFSANVTNHPQAWFVPFDYTVSEDDAENFQFYKVNLITASKDEQIVEDNTKIYIYIETVPAGTVLKANRPYMIKPFNVMTGDDHHIFKADNVTLQPIDETSRLHMSTAEWNYDFFGTYATKPSTKDNDWLLININGKIAWSLATTELHRYRWLIKVTSNFGETDYSKLNVDFIESDGSATGITTIDGTGGKTVEGYYTVDGKKLDKPAKGINIVRYTDNTTKKLILK